MTRRKPGLRRKLLLVVGGILTPVFVFELVLRLAGISYPNFYRWDDTTGTALRPNIEGWWQKEGEAHVRINSAGLRDREHTLEKPNGAFRIAVLGDSYAESFQVPMEEAFWAVLERSLVSCEALQGLSVEVINFGVSGYGTAQELLAWRERASAYSPDMVILACLPGNDVRNNSRALEGDPLRPYFIRVDGRLELDDSFNRTRAFRMRQGWPARGYYWGIAHLRLLQLITEVRARLNAPEPAASEAVQSAPGAESGLEMNVYRSPKDADWIEAWEVTEELIALMCDEVRQTGAEFLVVTLSNGIQVHPQPEERRAFMERFGLDQLDYAEERLQAFAEERQIPLLTLAPALRDRAERKGIFLHGFGSNPGSGHWNKEGHRAAGELIARKICDLLETVETGPRH